MKKPYRDVEETPFRIEPGRYFHTMFYYPFPPSEEHILGGNVTGLIWHLEDEPESWRVVYRFRYYKSTRIDSEDSGDTFSWYVFHVPTQTPEEILALLKKMFTLARPIVFGETTPSVEPDGWEELEVKGGFEQFLERVKTAKVHWLTINYLPLDPSTKPA